MGIKVTEMTEATQVNNSDWLMIVQNGENKKITKENLQDSIVDAELEERVDTLEDNVEALQDEVEALQEENAYLNSLVNQAFDKKEVEGEELSINDTINAKMEVELEGNIKQKTTTGKQLFDKSNVNVLNAYIDNTNGNIGSDTNARCIYIPCKANTTYTVSKTVTPRFIVGLTSSIPANNVQCLSYIRNDSAISITIEGNANAQYLIVYLTNNYDSNTWNSILNNIMINEGSASSYEKYTGGVASPNPSYPSNVNVVTGDNTIKVFGKNIVSTQPTPYNATVQYSPLFSTDILANIKNGENYTLSFDTENTGIGCYFQSTTGISLTYKSFTCDGTRKYVDFTATQDLTSIPRVIVSRSSATSTTGSGNCTNVMIEKGSTATSFIEHQEQTYQVNLGTIELCKIRDYRDYFYKSKSNNKWYLHKEIGKVVLDGSENFISAGTSGTDYRYNKTLSSLNIPNATTNNALCMADYFENVTIKTDKKWGAFYINGNWLVFYDKDNNFENATAFNTWLSTHNTIIYYVLATPTNTEITDTTLISQLEALKTAMSYAEQTNISQINDDAPFILQVTALASYNSRILALENAILNANRSTPTEQLRKSNEIIEEPKEEVVDDNKDEPKEENKEKR